MKREIPFRELKISHLSEKQLSTSYLLLYSLKGKITCDIDGSSSEGQSDSIFLIEPGSSYHIKSFSDSLTVVISFDPAVISHLLPDVSGHFLCNSYLYPSRDYSSLRMLITNVAHIYYQNSDVKSAQMCFLGYGIISELIGHFYEKIPGKMNLAESRIHTIRGYISAHYSDDLSLGLLADYMGLSVPYLSRLFNQLFGITFSKYVNRTKTQNICIELENSNDSIISIASANGFSNISQFNRIFKESTGMTPHKYREQKRQDFIVKSETKENKEAILSMLSNKSEAGVDLADILSSEQHFHIVAGLNNRKSESFDFSERIINIATGSFENLGNIEQKLKTAQESIGFKYGRLELVLSHHIVPVSNSTGQPIFHMLNEFLMTILSHGLIPYLDVSEEFALVGSQQDFEVSGDRYLWLFSSLLTNFKNTFPRTSLQKWVFEVGYGEAVYNRYYESAKSYANRYILAYRYLKRTLPNTQIGLFFYDTILPEHRMEEIFQLLSQAEVVPDFIGTALAGSHFRNVKSYFQDRVFISNPLELAEPLGEINYYCRKYFGKIEIRVESLCISYNNYLNLNDCCYQSVFLTKYTLELIKYTKFLGYYSLNDSVYSYYSPTSSLLAFKMLSGYPGLMSYSGIKKPGFHALSLLSKINGSIISQGENHIIVQNRNHLTSIVVFNYVHLLDEMCDRKKTALDIKDTYSVFKAEAPKVLDITLKMFPNSSYRMTTTTISRKSGSLFDLWIDNDFFDYLQPDVVEYYIKMSEPHMQMERITIDNETLQLSVKVDPLEVSFISISPILD